MFFKFKQSKVIIMGLNYTSLNLAQKLSINRDVVILYNNKKERVTNYNIDVIIEKIKWSLVDQIKEYLVNEDVIFISLTENDEYNLFAAQLAKRMGAGLGIAAVNNKDYLKVNLDIDLIFNPLQIIIDRINCILKKSRLNKIKNLIPGKVNITQIKVKNNDTFSYKKLKELAIEEGIIIAIKRDKRMIIPDSSIKLLPADYLYILYKRCFTDWLKIFNSPRFKKKKIFQIGSGRTGKYFINYWQKIFDSVIVIEPELKKCNQLATRFEKPLILQGEVTDLQLLREEGINKESVFITCSNNDFHNLLSSFGAESVGCKNVLTLLNRPENMEIAKNMNLNTVLYKPEIVSDYIMSFIKTGLEEINKYILGKEIYTAKFKLGKNSKVINKMLKNLNIPAGVIIGVIVRNGQIIIPGGETMLEVDDTVITFFNKSLENKIGSIFS